MVMMVAMKGGGSSFSCLPKSLGRSVRIRLEKEHRGWVKVCESGDGSGGGRRRCWWLW